MFFHTLMNDFDTMNKTSVTKKYQNSNTPLSTINDLQPVKV